MKKLLLTTLLGGIMFVSSFSQVSPFTVNGRVTDYNGSPLAFKTVHLKSDTNAFLYNDSAVTDTGGYYSKLITLPAGHLYAFSAYILNCANFYSYFYFQNTSGTVTRNIDFCNLNFNPNFTYVQNDSTNDFCFTDHTAPNRFADYWFWKFGDGTTSTLQNPSHLFYANGIYTVKLRVTSKHGIVDSISKTVNAFKGIVNPCGGSFYHKDSNLTVRFYARPFDSTKTCTFLWHFGDGYTSTSKNPVHKYNSTGSKHVCLQTITDNGTGYQCVNTHCSDIFLFGNTSPQILGTIQGNEVKLYLDITDSTKNYTYHWDFGDGYSSNLQSPTHTYAIDSSWISSYKGYFYHKWNINVIGTGIPIDTTVGSDTFSFHSYITISTYINTYLHGAVTSNGFNADHAIIYLIRFNPVDSTLIAIDTTYSKDTSGIAYYNLRSIPYGKYLLKAALTSKSVNYPNCMPTYYGNVLFWNSATYIDIDSIHNNVTADIELINGSNPGGPGFIGGKTSTGANMMINPGDPVPSVEMLLLDNTTGLPVSCKYSDLTGNFGFNNLAYGIYKVYAEVPGIITDPAIVSINAANQSVSNLKVIIGSKIITSLFDDQISGIIKGIGNLYPNPASDQITVEVNLLKSAAIDLSITNMTGQLVYHSNLKYQVGPNNIQVHISDLSSGLYNFILKTEDGGFRAFQFMVK